jgi:hypothetical protein
MLGSKDKLMRFLLNYNKQDCPQHWEKSIEGQANHSRKVIYTMLSLIVHSVHKKNPQRKMTEGQQKLMEDINEEFLTKFIKYWFIKPSDYQKVKWRKDASDDEKEKDRTKEKAYAGKDVFVPKVFL